MNDYQKQALDFLKKTDSELKVVFLKHGKHFDSDEQKRDIYICTLLKNGRHYIFNFGQSIQGSKRYRDKNVPIHKYLCDGSKVKSTSLNKMSKYFLKHYCIEIKGEKPSAYDVLSCLTIYDPETHKDFCDNYGYDIDSISALRTYKAVQNEYENLSRLYSNDELELMAEIQ